MVRTRPLQHKVMGPSFAMTLTCRNHAMQILEQTISVSRLEDIQEDHQALSLSSLYSFETGSVQIFGTKSLIDNSKSASEIQSTDLYPTRLSQSIVVTSDRINQQSKLIRLVFKSDQNNIKGASQLHLITIRSQI